MVNGKHEGKTEPKKETKGGKKSPGGVRDGWFSEIEALWPGQKFSLALESFSEESILFSGKSNFQSILVFRSAQYGNVLALDGVIQLTERDEFAYQEMIVHLPLFSHRNPKHVLIVGGGDGGVLREVCRHDSVESITMVEIDAMVIEVSRKFFADTTATSFDDSRLTIVHEDAAEFLQRYNEAAGGGGVEGGIKFDVIIGDTSDPVGPAETLFQPEFYEHMHAALNDGGIICAQGECFWIHLDLIADVIACCSDIFDYADYATTMVPTYPCGQIGFIMAGKGAGSECRHPRRRPSPTLQSRLRWYNPEIHRAAFVLPTFVEKTLAPIRRRTNFDKERNGDRQDVFESGEEDDVDCFLSRCTVS